MAEFTKDILQKDKKRKKRKENRKERLLETCQCRSKLMLSAKFRNLKKWPKKPRHTPDSHQK